MYHPPYPEATHGPPHQSVARDRWAFRARGRPRGGNARQFDRRSHAHLSCNVERRARRAPAGPGGIRRNARGSCASRAVDAPAGCRSPGQLRRHRQQRGPAVRGVRRLGSRHGSLSAESRRCGATGPRTRRSAWRARAARRVAAPASAGRGQVLLWPAGERHRDAAPRRLVGQPHAHDEASARGEADAVLARSLRDRRRQGARLPDDAGAEPDAARERVRATARRCSSAS